LPTTLNRQVPKRVETSSPTGPRVASLFALATLALGCLLALMVPPATAAGCPNARLRIGDSSRLPDCRAYEMVSPRHKDGYDITFGNQAVAPHGGQVTYDSLGSFAGNPAGAILDQYLSTRTTKGWSTKGISPREAPDPNNLFDYYVGFSSGLSHMVVQNGDPPVDGATPGTLNLYVRGKGGALRLITVGEPKRQPSGGATYMVASADFTHILFEDPNRLVKRASSNAAPNLYEWVNGKVRLIAANGGLAGSQDSSLNGTAGRAMSADGSRFYWTGSTKRVQNVIHMTHGRRATAITASQCKSHPKCTKGDAPGDYWTASVDGLHAFFTSHGRLTNRSTAHGAGYGDLYEYDAATGKLSDLTVDEHDPHGADVQGVIGSSQDGSYVYYVADGVLAKGASPGKCSASAGTSARCNLYVWHGGKTRFVASVIEADAGDWGFQPPFEESTFAQVAPDGKHLLFTSSAAPASGYRNAGHSEVYLYGAESGSVTCVSCNPTGAAAKGDAAPARLPEDAPATPTAHQNALNNMAAGAKRVFFESTDALVPRDTNKTVDVYEWETDGTGSCRTARGCVYLISTGKSKAPSYFEGADRQGNNVFFLTVSRLVRGDRDANYDLYDARVNGGFAASPHAGS
jgi:hypothetical protein